MRMHFINRAIIIVAAAALILSPVTCLSQFVPKPIRLRFPRGKSTAVIRGLVGGEMTDSYLVRARAGQKLFVRAISPLKRTQVYVSQAEGDVYITEEPERSDLTCWEGRVGQTGDYLIKVNVYPGGEHYTLRVTVKW